MGSRTYLSWMIRNSAGSRRISSRTRLSVQEMQHPSLVFSTKTMDELQPVKAGAGRFLKVEVGKRMDTWPE